MSHFTARRPRAAPNAYAEIAALSEDAIRSAATFTGLVAAGPHVMPDAEWDRLRNDNQTLRSWQRVCLELLAASLSGELPRALAMALLDHLPAHVGWRHHRELPLRGVGTPVFFRTDQARDGRILEVQCPGSLWGVHEILHEFYSASGDGGARRMPSLSSGFADAVRSIRGAEPVVHHLMDNSSHPAGERFFAQRARRHATYFGFDPDVRPESCNLVRAHDFLALLSENFTAERVQRLRDGDSVYDLPPIAPFDQKLLLALPFWEETGRYFDDSVRELFPYATVLTPRGCRLETGEWVSPDQFAALPRRRRHYFLKYAGADVARNWGSRAVFHLGKLSREACGTFLRSALERYDHGERWILQREVRSEDDVAFLTREGETTTMHAHTKHSTFYGPHGPLGVLVMFERFYKVHGSSETIATVGVTA